MTEPIIFFLTFILFLVLVKWMQSENIRDQFVGIDKNPFVLHLKKEGVECSNGVSGTGGKYFLFFYADLYFYENAFIIVGYKSLFKKKFYKQLIIITNEKETYQKLFPNATIPTLRRFNPNSFGGDVHIEFGKASLSSSNINIRLKGLSEKEKELIFIQ